MIRTQRWKRGWSAMIVRTWNAHVEVDNADAFAEIFEQKILPHLRSMAGWRGSYLLSDTSDQLVEFRVVSFWESLADIHRYAGDDELAAVVDPDVAVLLASYDERVTHHNVVIDTVRDSA